MTSRDLFAVIFSVRSGRHSSLFKTGNSSCPTSIFRTSIFRWAPASQSAAAPTAPAAAPMASGTAIASAQFGADPNLRCDLLEVKRTSGGALLIRWRLINTAGAQSTGLAAGGAPKPIYYNFDWQDLYYTDPAENKKYAFLTDSENNRILDVFWGNFSSGEQHLNWAKFPAPPPTSSKITVYIPKFMPFEDVPVSQ